MCWGDNSGGKLGNWPTGQTLGDNEPVSAAEPVRLPLGTKATQVCTGFSHTCALLNDSSVVCWGDNGNGQLGNTNISSIINPYDGVPLLRVNVSNPTFAVTQVACGGDYTCALLSSGDISCWGLNDNGQLGRNGGNYVPAAFPPTHVTSNAAVSVVELSLGYSHSCARLSDGYVTCWGDNEFGQLGILNTTDVSSVSSVSAIQLLNGSAYNAIQIEAGWYHTCALLDDYSVHCWGFGNFGQLGYSSASNVADSSLTQFIGRVNITTDTSIHVVQISAGFLHTCTRFNDGSLKCWGHNVYGQLGLTPVVYTIGNSPLTSVVNYGQIVVGGARSIPGALHVVAAGYFTCALFGTVPTIDTVCWGRGNYGILGNQNSSDQFNVSALPSIGACNGTVFPYPTPAPYISTCSYDFTSSDGGFINDGGFLYGTYTNDNFTTWSTNLNATYANNLASTLTSPPFLYYSSQHTYVTLDFSRFETESFFLDFLSVYAKYTSSNQTTANFVPIVLPTGVVEQPITRTIYGNMTSSIQTMAVFGYNSTIIDGSFISIVISFTSDSAEVFRGVGIRQIFLCSSPLFVPTASPTMFPTMSP